MQPKDTSTLFRPPLAQGVAPSRVFGFRAEGGFSGALLLCKEGERDEFCDACQIEIGLFSLPGNDVVETLSFYGIRKNGGWGELREFMLWFKGC